LQGFESGPDQVSNRTGRYDVGESSRNLRLGEPFQEFPENNAQGQLKTSVLDEEAQTLAGKFVYLSTLNRCAFFTYNGCHPVTTGLNSHHFISIVTFAVTNQL
jgi:hypothetical protein